MPLAVPGRAQGKPGTCSRMLQMPQMRRGVVFQTRLLGGPEGPEPALGEKNPGLSHSGRFAAKQAKQQKFSLNKPGGRAIFFVT
jgi:hypothetical protein